MTEKWEIFEISGSATLKKGDFFTDPSIFLSKNLDIYFSLAKASYVIWTHGNGNGRKYKTILTPFFLYYSDRSQCVIFYFRKFGTFLKIKELFKNFWRRFFNMVRNYVQPPNAPFEPVIDFFKWRTSYQFRYEFSFVQLEVPKLKKLMKPRAINVLDISN